MIKLLMGRRRQSKTAMISSTCCLKQKYSLIGKLMWCIEMLSRRLVQRHLMSMMKRKQSPMGIRTLTILNLLLRRLVHSSRRNTMRPKQYLGSLISLSVNGQMHSKILSSRIERLLAWLYLLQRKRNRKMLMRRQTTLTMVIR